MRDVIILGSTGSIGTQTLDVVRANPDRFRVVGIAAGSNRLLAHAQAEEFGIEHVAFGADEATQLVQSVRADVVVNGITGAVGLEPTLAVLASGATLALANKESLIIGGSLVTSAAAPRQIVPVDSEHSALAQGLLAGKHSEVAKLIVTASGGPFRGYSREQLASVTPAQAAKHPTWNMGSVITTNSSTLVNKGLEVIEASLLFDIPLDRIEVTVHPQSVIHSFVEFVDGSTMAQCSPPDMHLPIALGLEWPNRVPGATAPIDWTAAHTWTFEPLDDTVFPAVRLAREVGAAGSTFPAVYNAANEVAVEAFNSGQIGFLQIVDTIQTVIARHEAPSALSLDAVLDADAWARRIAKETLNIV
ncbi:1-deoxy-D-xylulose 5-phosphate reductoisomerase [Microbacteriaceae bacterium MWH-Ta3]|nr:1-deoxy-D-xylulose 5-phosphate reductoisomerase [Microbacteriaceae bacterium MWH-Ta3]